MARRTFKRKLRRGRRRFPKRRRGRQGLINQTRLTSSRGFGRPRHGPQLKEIRDIIADSAAAWYFTSNPATCGSNYTPNGGVAMTSGLQAYAAVATINSPLDLAQCACVPDKVTRSQLQANKKFVINSISTTLTYKNTSTADCFLDLYLCKARKNISANDNSGNNVQTWSEYAFSQSLAGGGASSNVGNIFGVTPFQAPGFIQMVKILSKTTTLLSPGAVGSIPKIFSRPQLYNTDDIGFTVTQNAGNPVISTTPSMALVKATYFYFAVVRGVPGGNSSTANTTSTQSNVDFNFIERYDIRYVVNAQSRLLNTDALSKSAVTSMPWANPSTSGIVYGVV